MSGLDRTVVLLCLLVGLGVRLCFMTGPLDEPSWRQADTAYMALRMGQEWPPEALQPKAPYRGEKDVKAAEFPVYPLLAGLLYHLRGGESLVLARLLTLLFFAGATWYLFRITAMYFDARVAGYAAAVYALLPLGLFYSRAVHPDFCIIFFAHAYLYYALRFYQTGRWGFFLLATAAATLAFLMKAPYCFYLGLPLAAYVLSTRAGWTIRNLVTLGAMFGPGLLGAWWFNEVRVASEAAETQSLVYPMKWTREMTRAWFFGTLDQRFDPERWGIVVRRVAYFVFTPAGVAAALGGLITLRDRRRGRGWFCLLAWGVGAVIFGLTVFPHFSSAHDYYSTPLLAPAAILIALGLAAVSASTARWRTAILALVLLGLVVGSAYAVRRVNFFSRDWQRIRAGEAIAQYTAPGDLVVSATLGRSTGGPDPRILYFANRRGWTIELKDLNPEALDLYRAHGADGVALLITPQHPSTEDQYPILASFPREIVELRDPDGQPIGHLVLFRLNP